MTRNLAPAGVVNHYDAAKAAIASAPRGPQPQYPQTVLCESCGKPVNPMTAECGGCSD